MPSPRRKAMVNIDELLEAKGNEGLKLLRAKVKQIGTASLEMLLEALEAEEESLSISVETARMAGKEDIAFKAMRALSWVKAKKSIVAKELARRMARREEFLEEEDGA